MVSGAFSSCLYWGAHLIWLCLYIYLGEAPSLHTNQNSPREIETSIRVSRGILFEHHRIHHLIWQNAAVTRFWRSFLPSSSAQSVSELSIPLQLISKHSPAPVTQSSLFSSLRFEFIHQNIPLFSLENAIGSTLYKKLAVIGSVRSSRSHNVCLSLHWKLNIGIWHNSSQFCPMSLQALLPHLIVLFFCFPFSTWLNIDCLKFSA